MICSVFVCDLVLFYTSANVQHETGAGEKKASISPVSMRYVLQTKHLDFPAEVKKAAV